MPAAELSTLAALEAGLDAPEVQRAFDAVRARVVASITRHEVQHRLDFMRGEIAMPPALEELVGPAQKDGVERKSAGRARAEMSAYLAELARDELTPGVGLTGIFRFLFDTSLQGSAECHAAVAIAEGLAAELGVAAKPLVVEGGIARDHAADLYIALATKPSTELRGAARRLWQKSFGLPLPELTRL